MFYHILRAVFNAAFGLIARRETMGVENLPAEPPYMLTTNHISIFDVPLLMTVFPHVVRAFIAAKHKRNPPYALLVILARSIWVRRGEVDRQALREAMRVFERGEVLGMAPEGTRARGPYALQKGKPGPAYLATRANALIVPVGITGTEKIKDELRHLRRAHVRVAIGKPFLLPETGRVRGEKLELYTDLIMNRIAELLPVQYRGVYE